MFSRVLVAVIFIPLLSYIMLKGNTLFFIFIEVIIGVAMYEFYSMMENKSVKTYKKTGIAIGLLIPLVYLVNDMKLLKIQEDKSVYIGLFISGITIFFIVKETLLAEVKKATQRIAHTLFGIIYIGFLFSHLYFFKNFNGHGDIFGFQIEYGRLWLLSLFLLVWASDSAAYFIGINFGKNKLLPKISPKKSIEGAIAGLFAPILSMLIIKHWYLTDINYFDVIIVGMIVGVFGQIGDLGESLFKRDYEIKDSGNVLLGHGGILDRFDSLIFVIPILYYYIRFFII